MKIQYYDEKIEGPTTSQGCKVVADQEVRQAEEEKEKLRVRPPRPIPMRQCRRCSHWSSRAGCTLLDLEPCRPVLRSWPRTRYYG